MTWNKLKNFLIGLFLCINIFLIVCTVNIHNSYKLSNDTIDATCLLLEKNGITIDKGLIPKSAVDFGYQDFEPISYDDISIITEFTSNQDGSVSFSIKRNNFYTKNAKNLLSELGFNKRSIIIVSDKTSDGERNIQAQQRFNGKTIYTSYINAKISKDGLAQITFKWYNITDGHNTELINKDPVFASSILADFAALDKKDTQSNTIIAVDSGYYVPTLAEQNQVQAITAIPVYCIKTDDLKSYYYNAYDGSLVQ